jgi:dimeric dUTPase (all-alpha-NTP-PPase superfamily)
MSNNKQQTAVEWLWEIAYNKELTFEDWKQAKEMEKQQIRKAYCDGEHYKDTKLSTDYYNETYGGGEQ